MLRASKHYPVGKDRKKFFIAEVAREIERDDGRVGRLLARTLND